MTEQVNEVLGVVVNCKWLDLRCEPDNNSAVAYIACCNEQLLIDLTKSTDEFYHVYTSFGIEGYAGKEFIELKYQLR